MSTSWISWSVSETMQVLIFKTEFCCKTTGPGCNTNVFLHQIIEKQSNTGRKVWHVPLRALTVQPRILQPSSPSVGLPLVLPLYLASSHWKRWQRTPFALAVSVSIVGKMPPGSNSNISIPGFALFRTPRMQGPEAMFRPQDVKH